MILAQGGRGRNRANEIAWWAGLTVLLAITGSARARVLARGTASARRGPRFVRGRRALELQLRYDAGRIVLKKRRQILFKAPKKFYPMAGRFELSGFRGKKRVVTWRMDFPFLGKTAIYSKRDRRLMTSLQGHVHTSASVLLPVDEPLDRLVIRDLLTGHRSVLFVKKKGPMCRTGTGARHRGADRKVSHGKAEARRR